MVGKVLRVTTVPVYRELEFFMKLRIQEARNTFKDVDPKFDALCAESPFEEAGIIKRLKVLLKS